MTATSSAAQETAPAAPGRFRWAIIGQLWAHQVLAISVGSGLGVMLVEMQADLAFGTIGAGWLGSARTAGQFIVFPLSFLIVAFSPKRVYGLLLASMAVAVLVSGLASTFAVLLASQVIFSFSMSLSMVPAAVLRSQWVRPQEMARVWGLGNATSAVAQSITLASVPLVLAWIGSWRPIFLVVGCLTVAATVLWALTARERRGASAASSKPSVRNSRAWRRREFYVLGMMMLGGGTAYTTAILFLPLYFVNARDLSLGVAGTITAVLPAAGLASNLSSGFLSDRLSKRKMFIWPVGVVLPLLYLLLLAPLPVPALAAVVFALGYFAWFPFPVLMSIPYELQGIESNDIAIGQSLMQAVAGVGFVSGPLIASWVIDTTGSYGAGILAISFLPVSFALGCLFLPETGKRPALATSE